MTAHLAIHRDPFRIHTSVERLDIPLGLSIYQILSNQKLIEDIGGEFKRTCPYVVLLNGEAVLQRDWNQVVSLNDVVQIAFLPRGGGGGSNIKNILGAIIIAVAAYFTFGLSLYATVAVGAAAFVGLTMLNGAVPLPSTSSGNSSRDTTSPNYSLNAQGNQARLLEAIPRLYGRFRTYPDLASQPYNEYEGNVQYLYQLFCVSLGTVNVEKIFLDDSDINNFEDAEYQIIKPGEAVTLFPDNVITSEAVSGQDLLGPNNPSYVVVGPFVAAPANSEILQLGIDVALPRGAARINTEGNRENRPISFRFEIQEINNNGVPIGPWTNVLDNTVSFATDKPQVLSYKIDVQPGRYQVRGYRTSNEPTDTMTYDGLQWVGLRAYLKSTHVYGNLTMIAVKMRATNLLNSTTARRFSVLGAGLVQKWNPVDGWGALEFSDSPAWIACDIIRNSDYGRGLPTSRLNMPKIYQLAQTWEQRGDKFNGVFDTTTQLWDALGKVCRVGRAVPMYYGGLIDIVRDEPQTIPKAMFTPANMVMSSFKTVYNMFETDTPDHVIVEYTNPETWKPAQVPCVLPGGTALNPFRVTLFGCTDRAQAWREGISIAAGNRDRRRNISFSTLTEGLPIEYNALTRISHDVPQWGYSGRVISLNRQNGLLRTTEPIIFENNTEHYIAFRGRYGQEDGPYKMVPWSGADDKEGIFGCTISPMPGGTLANIWISDGVDKDYTFYQCGPSERKGLLALPIRRRSDAEGRCNLEFINYADSVHTAELGGNVPAPPPESNLPITPVAPQVDKVELLYTTTIGLQNIVATAANGATYYEFQAKFGDSPNWTALGTNSEPTLQVNLSPGPWSVRVRAVGRAVGAWAAWTGQIEATTLPTVRIDAFAAFTKLFAIGLSFSLDATSTLIARRIEIWASGSNVLGNAVKLADLASTVTQFDHTNLSAGQRVYYWIRGIDEAGRVGNWFNNAVAITAVAEANPTKLKEILQDSVDQSMLTQELLEYIEDAGGSSIVVQELINELAAMRTVKTQITGPDGKYYISAIGTGVSNNDGVIQSEVIVAATNFYVIDPNNPNDPGKLMFAVTPEGVVMDKAFISQLFVEEIISSLRFRSEATDSAGNPLIDLDMKNGLFAMRGQSSTGRMELNSDTLKFWNAGTSLPTVHLGDLNK